MQRDFSLKLKPIMQVAVSAIDLKSCGSGKLEVTLGFKV
jgi:hypothetical protein